MAQAPYSLCGSATTGSTSSRLPSPASLRKKQARRPVWQATPCWSTPSSRVSPSQSTRSSTSRWVWPEVSPLRHSLPRERDDQPGDKAAAEIGSAHVRTPVTNAHLVCRLLLQKKNANLHTKQQPHT